MRVNKFTNSDSPKCNDKCYIHFHILLKLSFNKNSEVIYLKFNSNFNNYINECENESGRMSMLV